MKHFFKFFLFVAMVFFITACPFEAPFPLDQPSVKYSTTMLGKWMSEDEVDSDNPSYYELTEYDEYSFYVEEFTYDSDDEEYSSDLYTAHLSKVGDYKFLNVYDSSEEIYYFYRMDWDDPDQFSLYPVTEYIDEDFESSEEMKIFFEKYLDLSFFYQSRDVYVRAD